MRRLRSARRAALDQLDEPEGRAGYWLPAGALAATVAMPTGLLMAWVLIESVQRRAFGWTMPFSVDAGLLLQTLLTGLLAAALAAIYPAWRSARRDPAPQLRED